MTTFYLVRHGETDGNKNDIALGWHDEPLNSVGHRQATQLATRLCEFRFDAVYCSTLMRARQTLAPFANLNSRIEPVYDDDLREQNFGEFENTPWEVLLNGHEADLTRKYRQHIDMTASLPGGESDLDLRNRVEGVTDRLIAAHAPHESILVVSHGNTLRAMFAYLLGIPVELQHRFSASNTGISIVKPKQFDPNIRYASKWNDTTHLIGNQRLR